MKELISVIVPIYNTEKYVKKCIESILEQTYQKFELILIDDGSTDNSLNIIREFTDERITVISKQNEGVSSTRNRGLDIAKGEYVLFIDSDDWIEPNMLEVLVRNILQTNADISCCQYDYKSKKTIQNLEIWNKDKVTKEFLKHKLINGALVNKLIKYELVAKAKFDSQIHYGEDALFIWDVLKETERLCITNQVLYHVTLHADSSTGGGFRAIRMESHQVWENISSDLKTQRKYYKLAKAQLGNMAIFSWYSMKLSKFENKNYEEECRNIIRKNIGYLLFSNFVKMKVKLFSCMLILLPKLTNKIIQKKV